MKCRHTCHRNPINCIVPPYVLDAIATNGTPAQRAAVLRTKAIDNTFRALRLNALANRAVMWDTDAAGATAFHKQRTIYTANNSETLPGTVVRIEGQPPTGDAAVDEAYDGLGSTFDFFEKAYGRNSIDDEGKRLDATVHFGVDYNNAFWNSVQMVFGDGDGVIFNRFTIALDVIGHELAHGVTEDEAQLVYFRQSGALNESLSDVFGSLIKQFVKGQTAVQADWIIGEGLLAPGINGVGLRSMKSPGTAYNDPLLGKDPQPDHMDNYDNTPADNYGVHINSGIPNHAFFQVAIRLGGFAWEKAGRIWYDTLRDPRIRPNTGFRRFAAVTYDVAQRLFGAGSAEHVAVRDGWGDVGITV